MLANAYLEWDVTAYWQKALNAIGLANSVSSSLNKYNTNTRVGITVRRDICELHEIRNFMIFYCCIHNRRYTEDIWIQNVS